MDRTTKSVERVLAEAATKSVCDDTRECCKELARVWAAIEGAPTTGCNAFEHVLSLRAKVSDLTSKLEQAEQDRERAEMQLAACTVAALGNTPESVATRIGRDNPYWSASYGDVCNAVDREMSWRAKLEQAEQEWSSLHRWADGFGYDDEIRASSILDRMIEIKQGDL